MDNAESGAPEIIPGLEEFWSPDESIQAIEREVDSLPPRFAPSRAAEFPYGVIYRGPWETMADGVCIAVRRNACALRRAKMPVFLQSPLHMHWNNGIVERSPHCELPPAVLAEVNHLTEPRHAQTVAYIEHFVPTTEKLISLTEPGPLGGDALLKAAIVQSTAAYIALENDAIPAAWIERLNLFGAIIVPCSANAEWLTKAGVTVRVFVVAHPLALRDPMRASTERKYDGGAYHFLHVGKWEPRKNQHALIGGFLLAFKPTDDAHLTIKSRPFWGGGEYPQSAEASVFGYWLTQERVRQGGWTPKNVLSRLHLQWDQLSSRAQLAALYHRCHCYVQSGRSEGFDLCALDAKICGMRAVAVGHGGPRDFLTNDDVLVRYERSSAPAPAYKAPEGTVWPAPLVSDYATALWRAYERRFEPAAAIDVRPYLLDSVGRRLRAVVTQLAAGVSVDLEGYER